MLRALVLALALFAWAPPAAWAEPPAAPDPYMAGSEDAPGPASLAGTRWRASVVWEDDPMSSDWSWVEFASDGQMNYAYGAGQVWNNGRWRQRGSVVVWDTNSMFSVGVGQIQGDRISGTLTNVRGQSGRWQFDRDDAPADAAKRN